MRIVIAGYDYAASDSLAQLAALQIPNLMVAGSNPVRVICFAQCIVQFVLILMNRLLPLYHNTLDLTMDLCNFERAFSTKCYVAEKQCQLVCS